MKKIVALSLAILLTPGFLSCQGQELSLDAQRQFIIEPGNVVLQHALNDYHHYYPQSFDLRFFDFYLTPFGTNLKTINGEREFTTAGAFMQTQMNFGDLWLRFNSIFGNVKEKNKIGDFERSSFGIDDVLLQAGYDLYFNCDDHVGFYFVGGLPTKRNLETELILNDSKTAGELIIQKTPELGTKNYRVGGGMNGGWTVYENNEHHLAVLTDVQYRFALPTTYSTVANTKIQDETRETIQAETDFSPGHSVLGWTALHYGLGSWNIELGSSFGTTFSDRLTIKNEAKKNNNDKDSQASSETLSDPVALRAGTIKTPDIIKFSAQPYLGFAYSGTIWESPATLGFGVSYDYLCLKKALVNPHALQGVTGWVTAALSF